MTARPSDEEFGRRFVDALFEEARRARTRERELEAEVAVLRCELDKADCTHREGGDRRHCSRTDREKECWRCRAEHAEAEMERLRRTLSEEDRARRLEEALRKAQASLESTRWNPNGPLTDWAASAEGMNHARVMDALETMRAALSDSPGPTNQLPASSSVSSSRVVTVEQLERWREAFRAWPADDERDGVLAELDAVLGGR